jgi:hypothetical protein
MARERYCALKSQKSFYPLSYFGFSTTCDRNLPIVNNIAPIKPIIAHLFVVVNHENITSTKYDYCDLAPPKQNSKFGSIDIQKL